MATRLFFTLVFLSLLMSGCDSEKESKGPPTNAAASSAGASPPNAQAASAEQEKPNNLAIKVLDVSERNRDGRNGIAITFSTQVDSKQDIQSFFSIQESKKGAVAGAWIIGEDRKQVWFLNTEPKTQYEIRVLPGLQAMNGSRLNDAYTGKLTTRELQASVNFVSRGSVLPAGYASGLPVITVNVPQIDVDFFRIRDEQLSEFFSNISSYGRYGWYANHLKQFGELSYSGRFDLNPAANTRTQRDIPIHTLQELKKPGLYFAVMRSAGEYDQRQVTWFSVTDIGVHIRQYPQQTEIHTSSLTSAKPLANIHVKVLDQKNNVLQEATTTANGTISLNVDFKKARLLIAQSAEHVTLMDLRQPALDLSEFELGKRPHLPIDLFIYAPRDLFRPGELATFSGLLRDFDGRSTHSPVLDAVIRAPNGNVMKEFRWHPQEAGYYETRWEIPADAPTGRWQLIVSGALRQPITYRFNVEEFLPERLKLSFDAPDRTVLNSSQTTIELPLISEYLYGAPAANNRLSAFYNAQLWRSPIEQWKDFQFGHVLDTDFASYEELNDVTLDTQGKATLRIPSSWPRIQSPLKVQLTASVYESGGRPVTRSHPILIWPQTALVGIRPAFGKENADANSVASFQIIKSTLAGELVKADNLEATLINEDRQYFWEFNEHDGWHWQWTEKEFPVATESLSLSADKPSNLSFPVAWGHYRLEIKDPHNNTLTSIRFFAGEDWYHDWQNAQSNGAARPDRINLALDKTHYQPGDNIHLKIVPPAAGEVLVLVEGEHPLWSHKTSTPIEGTTITIPVLDDWNSHNLYISALLIEPSGKSQQITPKRSLGLIHLPLKRDDRRLNIEIQAPEKVRPATTLQAKLKVSGLSKPETTYVTLAAVDVGVLNISNFKTPDPFHYFFGPRRYAAEIRDMYNDVIEMHRSDKAKIRFGGDADLARGGQAPQSEVQIVSLFHKPVTFNEQGEATIPLTLPDFNGRLRLMAVAFGNDAFGSADTEVTVAAPIVMEIAMPRFLAYGDQGHIALDVQNMTDEEQTFDITLSATESISLEPKTLSLTLQPKEKHTLRTSIIASNFVGIGVVKARLVSEPLGNVEREWKLGVRPAYPALTKQKQHILQPNDSFAITSRDLPNVLAKTAHATVELSSSINLQPQHHFRELMAYPYSCLEQTTSRGLPLIYANRDIQNRLGLEPMDDTTRFAHIQARVDRLVRLQLSNGAFGMWDQTSEEDHWLSAYAVDFLLEAQQQGADVPSKTLEKAIERLTYYLNTNGIFIGQRWSSNPQHYAFASRAYAAYVLSKVNKAPLGALRTLYQRDFSHGRNLLSQVHLGLALLKMGDQKNGQDALNHAFQARASVREEYLGDYGSPIRDLAQVVHLLMGHPQQTEQAMQYGLLLRDALRSREWFSTQERAALFLAGMSLEKNAETEWKVEWQTGNSALQPQTGVGSWRKYLDASDIQADFTVFSRHDQPLYANVLLNGFAQSAPAPVEQGLSIASTWYNALGRPVTPSNVKVGDLFLIHVTVSAQQNVPDALISYLLPAGLELENQNLEHAIPLERFQINGQSLLELQQTTSLKYVEYRDDRFVAALEQSSYQANHLFFVVRAVTPGTFVVPPPLIEDMYRPEIHSIGHTIPKMTIVNPQ